MCDGTVDIAPGVGVVGVLGLLVFLHVKDMELWPNRKILIPAFFSSADRDSHIEGPSICKHRVFGTCLYAPSGGRKLVGCAICCYPHAGRDAVECNQSVWHRPSGVCTMHELVVGQLMDGCVVGQGEVCQGEVCQIRGVINQIDGAA